MNNRASKLLHEMNELKRKIEMMQEYYNWMKEEFEKEVKKGG